MALRPTELRENGISGGQRREAGATLEEYSEEVFGSETREEPKIGREVCRMRSINVARERDF
jgi:hypothetical protein